MQQSKVSDKQRIWLAKNGKPIVTKDEVKLAKKLRKEGMHFCQIAKLLGRVPSTTFNMVNGYYDK